MRAVPIFTVLLASAGALCAQTSDSSFVSRIKYDGVLKVKYELSTNSGNGRFSVRNSRMGVGGDVSQHLGFRVQVELSSNGQFSVLDLYAAVKPHERFIVKFGQSNVPIYNDYTVSPGELLFANRPFVGKYLTPTRDIGVVGEFLLKREGFPITMQVGLSNGNSINKPVWRKKPAYSGRIILGGMTGFRATAKFYRYPLLPETDYLVTGSDYRYECARFKVEAEVMNMHNYFDADDLLTAYLQGAYFVPLRSSSFDRLIGALRWDAMGHNVRNHGVGVNRLTVGLGLSFRAAKTKSVLRLDYELYNERNNVPELHTADEMNSSKVTLEVVVAF